MFDLPVFPAERGTPLSGGSLFLPNILNHFSLSLCSDKLAFQ
jgi:hypothetical protein